MKKILEILKKINITDIGDMLIFPIALILAIPFKIYNKMKKNEIWLIIEGGKEARDNGYYFFKYMFKNHPNKNCYYVIDKKSKDYLKFKNKRNVIQYRSLKHWIYYLSAKYNISSQKMGNPSKKIFYFIHVILGLYNNRIFLQHGITKDDAKWLYYKNTKFKLFICGAKEEYDFIKQKFGYPLKSVVYTGFPRFDNLHNLKLKKNQILIMPTWRNWLSNEGKEKFENTNYFKTWNKLLNDKDLIKYIEKNKMKVLFYPHVCMQPYLKKFTTSSKNIEIINMEYDIQKALKESEILITDYSSVYMDFAYMKKKIMYFQFDYPEYRKNQYQQGYFDYKKNGFGPIVYKYENIVNSIKKLNEEELKQNYIKRMNDFFPLYDNKNCERIYNILRGNYEK